MNLYQESSPNLLFQVLFIDTIGEVPCDVMAKVLDCSFEESDITFTFGQIPLGKVWTRYPLHLAMG